MRLSCDVIAGAAVVNARLRAVCVDLERARKRQSAPKNRHRIAALIMSFINTGKLNPNIPNHLNHLKSYIYSLYFIVFVHVERVNKTQMLDAVASSTFLG